MRHAARIIILLAIPLSAGAPDHLVRALGFERHWNPYFRKLFGCPLEGLADGTNCKPALGWTDYREYRKARSEAKKLFDLVERGDK